MIGGARELDGRREDSGKGDAREVRTVTGLTGTLADTIVPYSRTVGAGMRHLVLIGIFFRRGSDTPNRPVVDPNATFALSSPLGFVLARVLAVDRATDDSVIFKDGLSLDGTRR